MPELHGGTVTFLFTDIEGSTWLLKQLGGGYGELLAEHQRLLRAAFAAHEGREVDSQGDSFFVVFRTAKDAVGAAVDAQRGLAGCAWPGGVQCRVRMGLHTGEPRLGGERYVGIGVHRAARIGAAGHGGQVLLSSTTRELVEEDLPAGVAIRDLGERRLKDLDQRQRLYQLVIEGLPSEFKPLRTLDVELKRKRRRMYAVSGLVVAAVAAVVIAVLGIGQGSSIGSGVEVAPNSVAVIDAATNRVRADAVIAGGPDRLAIGGGRLWVGSDDSRTLSALSPATHEVGKLVAAAGFPTALAAGEGALWVVDGKTGLLTKVDAAYGTPAGRVRVIAAPNPVYDVSREGFDPISVAAGDGSVWVTDGTRELVRVDPQTMVAQRINVPSRLDGIAVGAGAVWAVSGVSATALRLDPRGRVTLPIPIVSRPGFESPYPLEVSVGEGYVWVLNANTATVTKIDPGQRTVLATIPIGIDHGPLRLAVGSGAAWVANRDGTLTRIDPTTDAPTFIPVGHGLRDVAVAAGSVWVTVGTGLSGATGASTEVGRGRVRPLPSSSCSPIYYGSSGQPRYLIASDLPLQGSGSRTPQLAQAIQYVLKQHAFHAGRYAVGYQSCDDSTAPAGHWSAARCAANAHAYADDRSVIGVIGTFNSPCSQIEVPVLNRAALAIVSPANTYVGLTHSGPGSARNEPARYYPTGVRNYVRVVAADDVQGAADALLARQLGVRRVYVLHDDEPYGAGIAAAFRSAAVRLGIRIVGDSGWILSADSYVKVAGRVALSRPDGVFLGGLGVPGTNGGALVNDLRSTLPASVRIMAPDGFSLDWLVAAIGSAAEGMTASEPSVANERLPPQGRKFLAAFGKAVGEQPVQSSADAAQAAQILLDAIARSNGTRASVIAELFKTKVSNGILGSFAIDPNGDTTAAAVTIYKVVHAKPTVYKVITPPRSLVEAR